MIIRSSHIFYTHSRSFWFTFIDENTFVLNTYKKLATWLVACFRMVLWRILVPVLKNYQQQLFCYKHNKISIKKEKEKQVFYENPFRSSFRISKSTEYICASLRLQKYFLTFLVMRRKNYLQLSQSF